jgi:branched-chain amino acid aminotransferase
MGIAYIDGKFLPVEQAAIPVLDWGVTRSDATYDVVGVWNRRFFRLDDHLDRFYQSLAHLRLDPGLGRSEIIAILTRCVAMAGLDNAYVSMTCTRGRPPMGSRNPLLCKNRFYAFAVPYVWIVASELQERGATLWISDIARIPPASVDPRVKNYHWLDLVQAQFEALDHGAELAVVGDGAGNVTEGHGFNIFAVKDGKVQTPVEGTLRGITRRSVIEICQSLGIACEERLLPKTSVLAADELFATSTAGGVMPITKVNGVPLGDGEPGAITRRIKDTYWAWHADPQLTTPLVPAP